MPEKKISICIPAYKTQFLHAAIRSALGQTYGNIEILISDDCPNDDVLHISKVYGNHVRYLKNEDRSGRGQSNLVNLIKSARGDLIKFLFDDDLLDPFCVAELAKGFSNEQISMGFCIRQVITADSEKLRVIRSFNLDAPAVLESRSLIKSMLLNCFNPIGEFSNTLFSRRHLLEIGSTKEEFFSINKIHTRGLGDVSLYIKLLLAGQCYFHPGVLSYFRHSDTSNSNANYNPDFRYVITDWGLLIDQSLNIGLLSPNEFRDANDRYVKELANRISLFPDLEEEMISRIRLSSRF